MPSGDTQTFLPNGQQTRMPTNPDAPGWSDTAPGSHVFASDLEYVASGAIMWRRQRPLFQGIQTVAQSIAINTIVPITLDTPIIDTHGAQDSGVSSEVHAPLSNNSTDYFLCTGYVPMASTSTAGQFSAGFSVGGTSYSTGTSASAGAAHNVDCFIADLIPLSNFNYVELNMYQNIASPVSTVVSGKTPSLTVRWVGGDKNTAQVATPGAPHTWIDQDEVTADATGASSQNPGVKVPINREVRDAARWMNGPPVARLTSQGSGQSITNGGTWQSVQMPTKTVDNYGGWSSGANTRYTAQRPGVYLVIGYGAMQDSTATHNGWRGVRLQQTFAAGGSTTYAGSSVVPDGTLTSAGVGLQVNAVVRLAVGDYVELQMAQTQTNAPTSFSVQSVADLASRLCVVWMSL